MMSIERFQDTCVVCNVYSVSGEFPTKIKIKKMKMEINILI